MKKEETKKTTTENSKKTTKKTASKKTVEVTKKQTKKTEKKQSVLKRLTNFLEDVKKEMKKVRFPNKKEMITYSVATIAFILIFALFFAFADLIIAGVKMLLK